MLRVLLLSGVMVTTNPVWLGSVVRHTRQRYQNITQPHHDTFYMGVVNFNRR